MTPLHLRVDQAGRRADQFLADSLPQLTRSCLLYTSDAADEL